MSKSSADWISLIILVFVFTRTLPLYVQQLLILFSFLSDLTLYASDALFDVRSSLIYVLVRLGGVDYGS